jgi:hypothetical protein
VLFSSNANQFLIGGAFPTELFRLNTMWAAQLLDAVLASPPKPRRSQVLMINLP